jgi:radical SAM family uncharacterized protein/radical SAM-linked protein
LNCSFGDQILFRLFEKVTRPGRYLDNELNLRRKVGGRVRVLLAFPDLYEIGMSNLGLRVLHHVIDRHPDYSADLAFAPWSDMEEFMRSEGKCLCGLGTGTAAKEFDVLGFSLQHELQYTNVLNMLDLAGIPLLAGERTEGDPVVIAGGPCAYNPEPMADFIDAFVIGDGETVMVEIADAIARAKARGSKRAGRIEDLASVDGVYVPKVHSAQPGLRISRRFEAVLKEEDFPLPPVVPIMPITHDRLTLEIMRGCTRGCRFCSAGMLTRPVRERSVESVVRLAQAGIDASGWEEVSLVSLSSSDYAGIEALVRDLAGVLAPREVSISLPSMRPGTFSEQVARTISRTRRTGLTFAPEAGTDRLRRSVNKAVEEEDLYSTIETAFKSGWDSVKLYFMLGLPTEDDSDVEGLVRMAKSVGSICRVFGKRRHATVSISPFVPRARTPFQWEGQVLPEEILRRVNWIRRNLPDERIKLKWRDPYMSLVEGLLARGDGRCGRAVLRAWRAGARFDGWTDRFDYGRWAACFEAEAISIEGEVKQRTVGQALPWDYIDPGVSTSFLVEEARRAGTGELTPDCRVGECTSCGACAGPAARAAAGVAVADGATGSVPGRMPGPPVRITQPQLKMRVKYAKRDEMRFTSHLDVTRCIQRALRRARVPVCYSQGFSPHPRLSFGPPLPLGVVGEAEYLDMALSSRPREGWLDDLNSGFPVGLVALEARPVPVQGRSLVSFLNVAAYTILVWQCEPQVALDVTEAMKDALGEAGVLEVKHVCEGDQCRIDLRVKLKLASGAPEKSIERVLRQTTRPFKVIRKGLYLETDGVLYTPYGEVTKG